MIFGSKWKFKNFGEIDILIVNDEIIRAVKSKYQGVWFDQILADKISMKIGKIERATPFLSKSTRRLLVRDASF